MALLAWGQTKCSICHEVIDRGQFILATTHFISDDSDPLSSYSDTHMHVECFISWENRAEFAARYEARMGRRLSAWVPS